MDYRLLGRTGLRISSIGLGSWLTYGSSVEDATAVACVHSAFEAGINFFDTADVYAGGSAEMLLGRAIKDLPRQQIVVATKCHFRMWPGPLGRGLSRKHIVESVEGSLGRLGLSYIDMLQTHYPDKDTPVDETLRAMDDLRRQGKILVAACSNCYAHQLAEANAAADRLGITRFDSLQPEYSMLFRHVELHELPFCARHQIGVVCYSPLAEGVLTGKYRSAGKGPAGTRMAQRKSPHLTRQNLARVAKLAPIAKRKRCTLAQLALAWVLRRPEVTCAITGASRPEQIAENVKAADVTLNEKDLEQIEAALGNAPVKPW